MRPLPGYPTNTLATLLPPFQSFVPTVLLAIVSVFGGPLSFVLQMGLVWK